MADVGRRRCRESHGDGCCDAVAQRGGPWLRWVVVVVVEYLAAMVGRCEEEDARAGVVGEDSRATMVGFRRQRLGSSMILAAVLYSRRGD